LKEKYSTSPYAIYAVALSWIICSFIFPMYKLASLIVVGIVSVLAYFLAAKLLPKKVTLVEKDDLVSITGNEKIDGAIKEVNEMIKTIRHINMEIPDKEISDKLDRIEVLTGKIFDFIIENPGEIVSVRRFIKYYLPTTIKLLETYLKIQKLGETGENISESKTKIEEMLSTIVTAFEKLLDSLFEYTALDISAEISAMNTILSNEGLAKVDDIEEYMSDENTEDIKLVL